MPSQPQPPFTTKRRVRKYSAALASLPPLPGRIGDGSARASLELMADLRALINAGLIEPFVNGRSIRYAVVDANNEASHPAPSRTGASDEQQR